MYTHLHNKLTSFYDSQHGVTAKSSCGYQLILTIDDFATCLKNKDFITAIFLDVSKAFDKVAHHKLCYKLSLFGITGPL